MLIQNFRAAAQGHGKYCPVKNELRVRKGRKVYRFICGERDLWFAAPDQPEVWLPVSPDATVCELSRIFSSIVDSCENLKADIRH